MNNNFYNCYGWSDNTYFEANSIQKNNILTSGEVPYLLLKDIQYYNGLTARFSYANYDSAWRNSTSLMNQGQVARLYQDKYALEYVSYHPVQSLDYIYTEDSKPIIISNYYSNVHNDHGWQVDEFWKSNKQDIARLRNSSRFGDKQTILKKVTAADGKKEVSSLHYYLNSSRFLMDYSMISNAPNGNELYQYGYKIKDQSNNYYKVYNNVYTQYEYDTGQIQPKKKSTFVANNSIDDINSLMNPDSITSISEKIPSLYTYDDWGNILTQSDNLGNMAVMQYNGPNHKLSKSVYTEQGGDIQTTKENSYYPDTDFNINNRNQLWITVETYSYKNPSNVMKSDLKTTEYTQYDAIHKAPTKIKTNMRGEQFGLGNNDTEINFVYTDKGNVKYETTKVKLKERASAQDLTLGYEYYLDGKLKKTTYPDGSSFIDTFDVLNRLILRQVNNGTGILTEKKYIYNNSTRQISTIMPDGEIDDEFYTPFGTLTKQQRTINGVTRTINTNEVPDGVMVTKTMPYGDSNKKVEFVYDTNGRVVKETNAIGETTTYLYSNVVERSDNVAISQDTIEKTFSDGKKETSYYDFNSRLTKLVEKTPNGLKLRIKSYTYTPTGKISSEKIEDKDGNTHITKYRYDGEGNLIYIMNAKGEETRYTHNSLGQVIEIYRNNILQKYNSYNEIGWKLSEKNNSNQKETYEYGVNGNLNKATDRVGQIHNYSYTHDNQKERESITKNGTEVYWEQFEYDSTTRGITKSWNSENNKITYHYDQWKRLDVQSVSGVSYTLGYDSFDRMNTIAYPDGKKVSYEFDNLNRINTVSYPDMGTVTNVNVTSSDFNSIRTTFPGSLEQLTVTDAFGEVFSNRINDSSTTNFNETYSYDGFGNIDKIDGNGVIAGYKYDALNRIMDENPVPSANKNYTYNANGDRATSKDSEEIDLLMESKQYTYNSLNLLKAYSDSNDSATYTYYPDGLRATKTVNGVFTRYVYVNGKVIDELDASGKSKARNIQGSKLLFRKDYVNSRAGYYFYNAHGDIVKIIDADGSKATLKSYYYDIWGNLTNEDSNQLRFFDNPYKYSGELLDDESGLIYLKARYYDPSIGRFITEDTYDGQITNPLSQNLYTYVQNNPLLYTDPSGNYCESGNGRYAHSGGCTSTSSIYIPDNIKNSNPGKSITQLMKIYNNEKEEAIKKAQNIQVFQVQKNEVAAPYPNSVGGSILKGLIQAAGITSVIAMDQVKVDEMNPSGDDRLIFRNNGLGNKNLTPRPGIDALGLSFFLAPRQPKGVLTTMEAVNATGKLYAFVDKPATGHVAIIAVDPYEHKLWMASRENSPDNPYYLTKLLQKICIKY
ncbi:RHS repeat domain-containing protein [Paenibacillus odorifer]|uniref:Teneurin-like YD-shell domain-containing protein n=1 Tax=Paenibacillus odorifer TaxID=189426 RepID=A0ABX3GJP3_9BACL|nr:RHS repeat-associated core domain-containing protein [Paenibacillus odorifer]OMD19366.1 hypothetical protein BSO21_25750 [Paenibacillus odorifer]